MKTISDCKTFGTISKVLFFILLLRAVIISNANAQATLTSDAPDYAPGATATFYGTGFQPYENVTLVVHNITNPICYNGLCCPWTVQADANGNFTTTWTVCNCPNTLLHATATGETSQLFAELYFTDSGNFDTVDWHQASNEDHPSVPIAWINGILQPNNSDYFEGIGVPQRLIITGIQATTGNVHTLTFRHQAVKSGVHAYDFLMSWDQAIATAAAIGNGTTNELLNLQAQRCFGAISTAAASVCANLGTMSHVTVNVPDVMGDPTTLLNICGGFPPVPAPQSVDTRIACFEGIYLDRFIDMYGNSAITSATLTFTGYDNGNNDSYAEYTLTWTSASTDIVVLMAGRPAQSCTVSGCCGYGSGCGSGSVSGGPYHFILDLLDGHNHSIYIFCHLHQSCL
jgi:hypothetical protein